MSSRRRKGKKNSKDAVLEVNDLKRDRVLEKQVRRMNKQNAMTYEMYWPLKDTSHSYKLRCENDADSRKAPLEDILKKMDDRIHKHETISLENETRKRELEKQIMAKFACLSETNYEHPRHWNCSTELGTELNTSLRHPIQPPAPDVVRRKKPNEAGESLPLPCVHTKPWVVIQSDQPFRLASVSAMKANTRLKCRSDLQGSVGKMRDDYSIMPGATESQRKIKAKLGADIEELNGVLNRIKTVHTPRTMTRNHNRTTLLDTMQRPATRS